MGVNSSAVITENIVQNVSRSSASLLQQISQTNEGKTDINQNVTIHIDGKLSCLDLFITQDAKVSMRALNQATTEQMAALTAAIAQKLQAETANQIAQENKELNFLQSNLSVIVNTAVTNTQTEQVVNMAATFHQTISQSSGVDQTIILTVGETGEVFITGTCEFNQTSSIDYTSEQMVRSAMQVVLDQQAVQEAIVQWDNAVSQKNTGINLTMIIVIVIVIIIVVIAISLGVKFGLDAKRRKEQQGK